MKVDSNIRECDICRSRFDKKELHSLNEIMEDIKDYCENTRCSKCPLFSTGCFENSINTYDSYLDDINEPLLNPYDIISDYQMYKGDEVR